MLGLSNTISLLLFSVKRYTIYLDDPPAMFGCFNVYICYYVILDIDNNTTLLKFNWHLFPNYELMIYMLSFFHLCYYALIEKKWAVVVVIVW